MKKFTDLVNENESYKEYTAKFNLEFTVVFEATSESEAGYEADQIIEEVIGFLDENGWHAGNQQLLSVDLSAPAQNEQEQKPKPILGEDPEEEISQKVVDIFDLAEKKSAHMSVQEKALFFHRLASKFA